MEERMNHKPPIQTSQRWYQAEAGIILLLALFFPVGVYLMWKYANWPLNTKWLITGFFIFIALIIVSNSKTDTDKTAGTPKAPSAVGVITTPSQELQDTLPQEPKARIQAIVSKQGNFQTDFIGAPEDKPDSPPVPYEVVVNQKDYTEWRDKCDQAKIKALRIQQALYSDSITKANIGRVLINLRPVLSLSLGGDDGRATTNWEDIPTFYTTTKKSGFSLENEESVPLQKRTWVAGNQYSGFGACQFKL